MAAEGTPQQTSASSCRAALQASARLHPPERLSLAGSLPQIHNHIHASIYEYHAIKIASTIKTFAEMGCL